MPNAKDPRINNIVLTGKVRDEPESKTFGDNTVTKVIIEVKQLKKVKGDWQDQRWIIECKGWNKTAEKLQDLAPGTLAAFTGKLEADLFEYQGKERQKVFLSVFHVSALEAKESARGAKSDSNQQELPDEESIPEDDIPF